MELISTVEAGQRLGIHRSRVWALIRAGRLPSREIGGRHLIDPSDLESVRHRPPGRPKKPGARRPAAEMVDASS